MKINLISDCHLNFEDLTLPGGDVLIAAGGDPRVVAELKTELLKLATDEPNNNV